MYLATTKPNVINNISVKSIVQSNAEIILNKYSFWQFAQQFKIKQLAKNLTT